MWYSSIPYLIQLINKVVQQKNKNGSDKNGNDSHS